MTIDEHVETVRRRLQLLALETEKHDRQIEQAAKLVAEIVEGTAKLLRRAQNAQN